MGMLTRTARIYPTYMLEADYELTEIYEANHFTKCNTEPPHIIVPNYGKLTKTEYSLHSICAKTSATAKT